MMWSSSLCRTELPARSRRNCIPTLVIDCGADFRLSEAEAGRSSTSRVTPVLGRTGCLSYPASGTSWQGPSNRCSRVLPDHGNPGAAARDPHGLTTAQDVVIVAASGPRRRPLAQAASARRRADGVGKCLRRRRGSSSHARAAAELRGLRRSSTIGVIHPVLVPMSRGILATCTARWRAWSLLRGDLRGLRRGVRG